MVIKIVYTDYCKSLQFVNYAENASELKLSHIFISRDTKK